MTERELKWDVLDHGYVQLVEHWGSDERIIEAARMSTAKGFKGWGPTELTCQVCGKQEHTGTIWQGDVQVQCPACKGEGVITVSGDEKLLRHLWENKHTTPFEMAGFTIEVQAPIFVFREWHRHRTQSYNEFSSRYAELPNLFYVPSIERLKASAQSKSNKQSSEGGLDTSVVEQTQFSIRESSRIAREMYEALLAQGVAREIARLVIPVNQYSRMRASANLLNWFKFLRLRMDSSAQWEIRQYAELVDSIVSGLFPRTATLFHDEVK